MEIVEITTVAKTLDISLAEYEASYLCPKQYVTDEQLFQSIRKALSDGHYTTAQGALAEAVMRLLQFKADTGL